MKKKMKSTISSLHISTVTERERKRLLPPFFRTKKTNKDNGKKNKRKENTGSTRKFYP